MFFFANDGARAIGANAAAGADRALRATGSSPKARPIPQRADGSRLEEPEPEREPWETAELRVLFSSPVFTEGARPKAGGGEAAFWLPLIGIFTGARLGELAPLTAADVSTDEATGIVTISITEDLETGRRLKTRGSRRVIPVHPCLVRLGFLDFVNQAKQERGNNARLFPLLNPGPRGGFGEGWSKWFGRGQSLWVTPPISEAISTARAESGARQAARARVDGREGS